MTYETALEPVEQRTVELRGDQLTAVLVDTGEGQKIYVPVRPLCEYLGLAWAGQYLRLQRDPVLSETLLNIRVTQSRAGKQGGTQTKEMVCLPLKMINGWLFGINASRVKEEIQEKVIQYQRECYDILAQAFGVSETGLIIREETALSPQTASLAQIRDVALAVAQMAQDMILHEERLILVEGNTAAIKARLDQAAKYVGGLESCTHISAFPATSGYDRATMKR